MTNILFCRSTLPCLLGCTLLLGGCKALKHPPAESATESAQAQSLATREAEQLAQCQKELEALQPLDARQYKVYQQEFSRLMNGAAYYAGVRTQANSGTQETVDALYRYKARRLCANISQALLTGLADMGERVK